MRRKSFIAVGLAIFVVGFVMLCGIGPWLIQQLSTLRWPGADGVIVSSDYREFTNRRSGRGEGELRVVYKYSVEGKVYESDQFWLGINKYKKDAETVTQLRDRYVQGASIRVYFNPSSPGTAVSKKGVYWKDLIFVVCAVLLMICGISLARKRNWKWI